MDITALTEYRSSYIGDAANVSQLFYRLPLNDLPISFAIDDEACALTVTYGEPAGEYGKAELEQNLVFNAIAAMALIDNLSEVIYEFPSGSYDISRSQAESVLGAPLSALLTDENWQKKVVEPLADDAFVEQFIE